MSDFRYDYYRYYGTFWTKSLKNFLRLYRNHNLAFLYVFRRVQSKRPFLFRTFYLFLLKRMERKYGLEIPWEIRIGRGFYINHGYGITINPGVVLGKNINIHKGVSIGQENRGIRKGSPTIGDCVWIGINSTIVGNVKIGNDVLIAPNSYVNIDVPDHSVVIGNPCRIIQRENATESYINRAIKGDSLA